MLRRFSDLFIYTFLVFLCFINLHVFRYIVSLFYYFEPLNK